MNRKTKETDISLELDLDGEGRADISTGVGFFDHMLTHVAFHGYFDLTVKARGDLEVDAHHTVEDVGICLGLALKKALGERKEIVRYGEAAVAHGRVAGAGGAGSQQPAAFGGFGPDQARRGGRFRRGQLAEEEFWRALANNAGITLHVIYQYGENYHHMMEAAFKALGRALDAATAVAGRTRGVSSTKGVL